MRNIIKQKNHGSSSAESAASSPRRRRGGRWRIERKRQRRGNCCVLVLITSQQNCWSFHLGTLAGWSNVFPLRVSVLLRPVSASLWQSDRDANPSSSVTAAALCATRGLCREIHEVHTHPQTLFSLWRTHTVVPVGLLSQCNFVKNVPLHFGMQIDPLPLIPSLITRISEAVADYATRQKRKWIWFKLKMIWGLWDMRHYRHYRIVWIFD